MMIEMTDLKPDHDAKKVTSQGEILEVLDSGSAGNLSNAANSNGFFAAYKEEEKNETGESIKSDDSSEEDILSQIAKQSSMATSKLDPAKHLLKNEKLQEVFDNQDWKNNVMLNQLHRMI